MSLYNLL